MLDIRLTDGEGFNDCLTTTSADLAAFLDTADPGWDRCDNPESAGTSVGHRG